MASKKPKVRGHGYESRKGRAARAKPRKTAPAVKRKSKPRAAPRPPKALDAAVSVLQTPDAGRTPPSTPSLPLLPEPELASLKGWLGEAERRLMEAGIESPRLEAQILVAAALGMDTGALRVAEDREVASGDGLRIENFLRRRVKTREPVSRILGRREFWSLEFRITPAVLDPRPDSETLVEAALALFPDAGAPLRILDLGTGSGCLLLSVLHERPNAFGIGVDRSFRAVIEAEHNSYRLDIGARAAFVCSDWARAIDGTFDLILCNPPYVAESERAALPPEVARHDPPGALFAGPDGLDAYRAILPGLARLLASQGRALFEIGASQAAVVSEIARAAGLEIVQMKRDLAGRDRCVVVAKD